MPAISISTRPASGFRLPQVLLICGILSSLLYVFMNIYVAMQWKDYSLVSQTVSELSAIGAPTRSTWLWFGSIYTLLVIAFGIGVKQTANDNRTLRLVGSFIITYGLVSLVWPFAPMHLRGELPTITDTMHISLAAITVILMFLTIGYGSKAFGKEFKIYSIMTIVILVFFGILTAMDSPDIAKNLPTPFIGVWERINIGAFLLWIIVLAIILLQREKVTIR